MAKRRKITKSQAEKVAKMRAFLEAEISQPGPDRAGGIIIESEDTHITCIKGAFQNVTGFYIMGPGSTGDKMAFAEIHKIYTAALKDKDFKVFVEAYGALKRANRSSRGPVKDKEALNSKETAQDGNK